MADNTLLPVNATPFERAMAATMAPVQSIPVPVRAVMDPQLCPLDILPWLAFQRRVPEWQSGWSEVQKRTVVAGSYALHRKAATRWAVVQAIRQLGMDVVHQCWFEYGDSAHRFRLVVTLAPGQPWSNDNHASLLRLALRAKGAHDRLVSVNLARVSPPGPVGIGAAILTKITTTLQSAAGQPVVLPPARTRIGAASLVTQSIRFASAA